MRLLLLGVPVTILSIAFVQSYHPGVEDYASRITPNELREKLSVLASDSMEGRETGKRGQQMAAAYIRSYFDKIGLKGPAEDGFFQPISLYQSAAGKIYVRAGKTTFTHPDQVIYYGNSDSGGEVDLPLVYLGLAREADFDDKDIKGKAVLIRIDDGRLYNLPEVARARQKGAKMVLVWNTDSAPAFEALTMQARAYMSQAKLGLTKPTLHAPNAGSFVVSSEIAESLLGLPAEQLKAIAREDPEKKALQRVKLKEIAYKTEIHVKTLSTENVLGYLEGTDKKDEVVVITAHYDHIGIRSGGRGDRINNGADDDGSGTVAVMEIAKIFTEAKLDGNGPRRSILFMTFAGEEEGLLGSEYYTNHPVFPLENTVVDLNIDMVGRRDPQHGDSAPYVYLIGADKLSSDLNLLSERVNDKYCKLDFDYTYNDEGHPSHLYYRSDHWNFAKNNIPIIFYFDGIHEDYHKPSDEIDKIEFDLLARRVQCVFYTAWKIANRDERITIDINKN
jgi:Peptidase family M28